MNTDTENQHALLTIPEVAKVLKIGRTNAYALVKSDPSFPIIKIGKQLRVPVHALNTWIDSKIH